MRPACAIERCSATGRARHGYYLLCSVIGVKTASHFFRAAAKNVTKFSNFCSELPLLLTTFDDTEPFSGFRSGNWDFWSRPKSVRCMVFEQRIFKATTSMLTARTLYPMIQLCGLRERQI